MGGAMVVMSDWEAHRRAGEQTLAPMGGADEARRDLSLAGAIAGWLHENGYRPTRGESSRTGWEYASDLNSFRRACQRQELDLDAVDTRALALVAQAWAASPKTTPQGNGRPVSEATHNRRLASVSSFYHYAIRYDLADTTGATVRNPIERVKRKRVQPYAAAQALDKGDVQARLAAIDRATLAGKRDYALLAIAFTTGRRLAELQALRWGDVQLRDGGRVARIRWAHLKGGKSGYDDLDAAVTDALLVWLSAAYGARLGSLDVSAPLWLPLQHAGRIGDERPMSHDAIRAVYVKRLGVSKVHTSRHTFAGAMLDTGASVVELQERLAHSSLETTGHYAKALHGATNPYAGRLAAWVGVSPATPRRQSARITRPLSQSKG